MRHTSFPVTPWRRHDLDVTRKDIFAKLGSQRLGRVRKVWRAEVVPAGGGIGERRTLFGETDEIVNRKARAAHEATLRPIVCVGETLEQRERGDVEKVLGTQLKGSLAGLDAKELQETVVAYEPVWAIGTGRTATAEQAQEAHAFIRKTLGDISDETTADKMRIQYGGSVHPDNAAVLLSRPGVDGTLVGGASLRAADFLAIVRAAMGELHTEAVPA